MLHRLDINTFLSRKHSLRIVALGGYSEIHNMFLRKWRAVGLQFHGVGEITTTFPPLLNHRSITKVSTPLAPPAMRTALGTLEKVEAINIRMDVETSLSSTLEPDTPIFIYLSLQSWIVFNISRLPFRKRIKGGDLRERKE